MLRTVLVFKRVIRGTHQGRFDPEYLPQYLDEFVFRFFRRTSLSVGKKFMRIVQRVANSSKINKAQIHKTIESRLFNILLGFVDNQVDEYFLTYRPKF